jgi:hypothetical protein
MLLCKVLWSFFSLPITRKSRKATYYREFPAAYLALSAGAMKKLVMSVVSPLTSIAATALQ